MLRLTGTILSLWKLWTSSPMNKVTFVLHSICIFGSTRLNIATTEQSKFPPVRPSSPGHFPPPTTPEELGARILIQERYEKYGESEEVEMEVESEDEEDERERRDHCQPSQPDQDTQVQDMDEVGSRRRGQHSAGVVTTADRVNNTRGELFFFRDPMMRTWASKLLCRPTTRCHLHCLQLQTRSSFARTTTPKVTFFYRLPPHAMRRSTNFSSVSPSSF